MALPQHITHGIGGTISVYLKTRADNATFTAIKGDGSVAFGPVNATLSSVDTTLNAAVSSGGFQINVGSAAGINNAVKCWITDDPEEVLIKSIAGTVVALRRPLTKDHASNAAVQGTQFSYAVSSAEANSTFWDGRIMANIDGGSSLVYTAVECGKYPMERIATIQDLFDEQPSLYHQSMREQDWERALDKGLEDVLKRVAKADPDLRARVYPASREIVDATVYATLVMFYRRNSSEEAGQLYDRYRRELSEEVEIFCGTAPGDRNQDGTVTADDRVTPRTVRLVRS